MSHTRAYAFTRDIPDADVRPALLSAIEALYDVSDALDANAHAPVLSATIHGACRAIDLAGEALIGSAQALREEVEDAKKESEDADRRTTEDEDAEDLKEQIATLTRERDDARARLDAAKAMVEAHADLVAMARRFTSAAVSAGVPLRHARAVPNKPRGKAGAK
jgi:hypothetical protein